MLCLREIARDSDFKLNTFDDVFKVWASKGKKYVLSRTLFYKYLQIRNYLKDEIKIKYLDDIFTIVFYD